jgi:hypothetical protein
MGRFFCSLIFLGATILAGQAQQASPSPGASQAPQASPSGSAAASATRFESFRRAVEQLSPDQQQKFLQSLRHSQSPGDPKESARMEGLHKMFQQLSPDQQQNIVQNLHRWQALSEDEREDLRRRERIRKQKQEASTNEAYQKSGLQLNEDQRNQFRKRYIQERKKLEEQLQRETQEKRQQGNAAIVEELKKEFSKQPTANQPPQH